MTVLVWVGLWLALLGGPRAAAARPPAPPPAPGGTLHYLAHWRLLPAARATLQWSNQGDIHHIFFTADSLGIVSLFYPIRDRMQTNYDPQTFCTTSVDNNTLEGRRQRQTTIQYAPQDHRITLDETDPGARAPDSKHEVKPIPGCVYDLFTALDYVRAQPLHVGDVYNFPVNEGGKTVNVRLTVDLKETVTTPAGTFSCVRAEPTVFNSVFKRSGKMWIWFTDDAQHLPVQVEAQVNWGTILAQLTN